MASIPQVGVNVKGTAAGGRELEDHLGLHQCIEIWYVVDGYAAMLYTQDGDTLVCEAHGTSIAEALQQLRDMLA